MVPPTRAPYIAEPLGLVMRRGTPGTASSDDFSGALAAAGAGQDSATAPTNRPQTAPLPPGQDGRPLIEPPEIGQLPPIPADRSNRTFASFENPIPLVIAELNKLGIDPSQLKMELVDEHEVTWGGAITNHHIRTTFPNGMKEDFSLEWTLRNPRVTAVEMQRILRNGNRVA